MEPTQNQAPLENREPSFKQSLLVSVSILLAGAFIAGAMIYNGKNTPAQPATGGTPTGFPAADISKVNSNNDPVLGQANAPITIAYWYDYMCSYCLRHETETLPKIIDEYVNTGKAKLVLKDYAFLSEASQTIARYSAAVWEAAPDKFYEWHEAAMNNQSQGPSWATKENLNALATTILGAELAKRVDTLVTSKNTEYQNEIDSDKAEGTEQGIRGTPGTIIGTVLIPGAYPYAQIRPEIEKALKTR